MKEEAELENIDAKDVYEFVNGAILSSIIGTISSNDELEGDLEPAVAILLQLHLNNENLETWETLRKLQYKELYGCCSYSYKAINFEESGDEKLKKAAIMIQSLNPKNSLEKSDYLTKLENLEFIDKTIEERTFIKAKRFAYFICSLRACIKTKKMKRNMLNKSQLDPVKPSSVVNNFKLDFIPKNVNYEAGTFIELSLIGASIFMPWKWIRIREMHPKKASISVFSNSFTSDIRYLQQLLAFLDMEIFVITGLSQ